MCVCVCVCVGFGGGGGGGGELDFSQAAAILEPSVNDIHKIVYCPVRHRGSINRRLLILTGTINRYTQCALVGTRLGPPPPPLANFQSSSLCRLHVFNFHTAILTCVVDNVFIIFFS